MPANEPSRFVSFSSSNRFVAFSTRRKNSGRTAKEDIQADENRVADIWSSENFTKFGIASVCFLLFVFVFVIGPPPSEGRCSLPWC